MSITTMKVGPQRQFGPKIMNDDGIYFGDNKRIMEIEGVIRIQNKVGEVWEDGGEFEGPVDEHLLAFAHGDIATNSSARHTQGTDVGLDAGGANAITAATVKSHVELTTTPHVTDTEKTTWHAKSELALGGTQSTAHRGDHGVTAYDHSQTTGTPHVTDTEKNTWNAKSELALGESQSTAHRGDHGVTAYNHSQAAHAPSDANNYSHPATHSLDIITETSTLKILTDSERTKLAGLESSKFKGQYATLTALNAANVGILGGYAFVDGGVDEPVKKYIWDSTDSEWVLQQGDWAEETPATIKQKYEENANTNAFTDAEQSKLAGISGSANNYTHPSDGGGSRSDLSGATVISGISVNTAGHVTATTIRDITHANIGAEQAFTKNTAFNKNFGTTASTVCQGNDSRLSDARVASDVYAWAKAATKPSYTYTEVGAEQAFTKNTAFNKSFGTAATTVCEGNDSRLSDARTPTSHTHGNLTNAGAIGTTTNLPIITSTSGVLSAGSFGTAANTFCQGNDSRLSDARQCNNTFVNAATSRTALGLGNHVTHNYGTAASTVCQGNDSRLSDARTPTSHSHTSHSDIDQALLTTSNPTFANITGTWLRTTAAVTTRNTDPTFITMAADGYLRPNSRAGMLTSLQLPIEIGIACGGETEDVAVVTNVVRCVAPKAFICNQLKASVNVAPTGAAINVTVRYGATAIGTVVIAAGATVGTLNPTAVTIPVNTQIRIDVTQVGSTVAGQGLKVWVIGYRS